MIGIEDDFNLYACVKSDPLDRTDPSGLAEIELGLDGEAFIGGGIKLGGSDSFDTQTLEVGTKGTFGIGGGISAGVGLVASIGPGSAEPAQSTTTTIDESRWQCEFGSVGY